LRGQLMRQTIDVALQHASGIAVEKGPVPKVVLAYCHLRKIERATVAACAQVSARGKAKMAALGIGSRERAAVRGRLSNNRNRLGIVGDMHIDGRRVGVSVWIASEARPLETQCAGILPSEILEYERLSLDLLDDLHTIHGVGEYVLIDE